MLSQSRTVHDRSGLVRKSRVVVGLVRERVGLLAKGCGRIREGKSEVRSRNERTLADLAEVDDEF